jgi:hypothetical protein
MHTLGCGLAPALPPPLPPSVRNGAADKLLPPPLSLSCTSRRLLQFSKSRTARLAVPSRTSWARSKRGVADSPCGSARE